MEHLKIATFNVNSVKARLPNILQWLTETQPDIALLQEIKTEDHTFPVLDFQSMGYSVLMHGQKSYNGVAIVYKSCLNVIETKRGLPPLPHMADTDDQARYLEADVIINDQKIRIATLYLPNGNPPYNAPDDDSKYQYKLQWMQRLYNHVRDTLLPLEYPVILGGDYNVIPRDVDCHDAESWRGDALIRPETRAKFNQLLHLGLTEAWLSLHPSTGHQYSFWDYQKGAWQKDNGIRIDHFLLSPQANDKLLECEIDKKPRGQEKASDHTPVWLTLSV